MVAWRQTSRLASFALVGVAIAAFAIVFLINPSPAAGGVGYVKVCTLYGSGFLYVPGTDTCLNVQTDQAIQQSPAGAWSFKEPVSRWQWVRSSRRNACRGGKLVKVGDFTGSDLTSAATNTLQATTPFPLNLQKNQYVASILFRGGLFATFFSQVALLPACPSPNTTVGDASDANCTAGAPAVGGGSTRCEVTCANGGWVYTGDPGGTISSNFCLYYYYPDAQGGSDNPLPLGCANTRNKANLSGTIQLTATSPVPRSDLGPVDLLLANGERSIQPGQTTSVIQGQLSVWVCLRK